jgi:TPR repeat protein
MATTLAGTPNYMAPEVLKREPYSFPSDIWSFGCVMYQLIMLKLPFVGRDILELLSNITEGKYLHLKGNYHPKLIQTFERMLIVDTDFRISIEDICNLSFLPKVSKPKTCEKILSSEELNSLGIKYENGEGVEKNLFEAMKYYKKSSDLGNAFGMVKYGNALENGWSGEKNLKEAMKYYKMSTDLGNTFGMYNYGIALANGFSGETNLQEAMKYYKKSADLGDSFGMSEYGFVLSNICPSKKNLQEAMKYFKMSADLGNASGMNNYGYALANGYSGEKNLQEAIKYYKKSADLGNTFGMNSYGAALEIGWSGEKKSSRSDEILQKVSRSW